MKKKIQKPFDVEAAKGGAKVETKDGKSIRILCYDRVGTDYPIVALLNENGFERVISYTIDGKLCGSETDSQGLIIIDEIESKFDEGDYIVGEAGIVYKITEIDDRYHTTQVSSGYRQRWTIEDVESNFHKWTLEDAKPGDVLVCKDDNRPFIFSGIYYNSAPSAYCGIDTNDSIRISNGRNNWTVSPVRPATSDEIKQFYNKLEEEGYKWDTESLTLSKIQKRWRDDEHAEINGYFINSLSQIVSRSGYNTCCYYNLFATEKQARSARAMARISQIMANDERFGGVVTYEEWSVNTWRYVIVRMNNDLLISLRHEYEYLAFHTKEQAELFLKENEDLVKDYYMMD